MSTCNKHSRSHSVGTVLRHTFHGTIYDNLTRRWAPLRLLPRRSRVLCVDRSWSRSGRSIQTHRCTSVVSFVDCNNAHPKAKAKKKTKAALDAEKVLQPRLVCAEAARLKPT